MVLEHLRDAAPADLYEELLGTTGGSVLSITVEDLPMEWRCNVREAKKWNRKSNVKAAAPRDKESQNAKNPNAKHPNAKSDELRP